MAQSNLPGVDTPFGRIVEVSQGQFAFSTPLGVYAPTEGGGFQGFIQNEQGQWSPAPPSSPATVTPSQPPAEPMAPENDFRNKPSMEPPEGFTWIWNGAAWEMTPDTAANVRREQQESAWGTLQTLLSQFGLGSLTQNVRGWIEDGIVNTDELVTRIRSTPEYKVRFPAMERRLKAGFNAISEAAYVGLEQQYRQTLRTAGLPNDFYNDQGDFANLIAGDVSVNELSSRIREGYQAVAQASPTVVNEMRRLYGVDEGGLAAYFLDPEKATPILLRQAQAAQIGAQAQEQAGMAITTGQAEQLAVAGVGAEQARQGFQTINQAEQLFVSLPGTTEQAITQEEQIAGVFGTQAAAQQRVRQRARERAATFQAGGRFAGQGTTVTGLQ